MKVIRRKAENDVQFTALLTAVENLRLNVLSSDADGNMAIRLPFGDTLQEDAFDAEYARMLIELTEEPE